MRRRDFIASVGAIAAWPTGARTQQATTTRRVGALMGLAETDPFTIKYVQALHGALEKLGWTEGQNIQFIYRYAAGDPALARTYAKQLAELAPDLIVGHTTPVAAALSQATYAIPVVPSRSISTNSPFKQSHDLCPRQRIEMQIEPDDCR